MTDGQRIVLQRTIDASPVAGDFRIEADNIGAPGDGELLVRSVYLSLDPYIGSVLRGRHLGESRPGPGETPPGRSICEVLLSRSGKFREGDYLVAETGWRSHAVIADTHARRVDPDDAPLSAFLGVAGMPGLTAYAGLKHLAKVSGGEEVLISSAAGGVGGAAGQIARILGARRIIGLAGGPEKCAIVEQTYGFDACIDYRGANWRDDVAGAFPDGVNVYFDNVGGDILNTALANLALYGRVVLCGLASQYQAETRPDGPNPGVYIARRAQLYGLVVYDFLDQQEEYSRLAGAWIREGRLSFVEDRANGLDAAPAQFEKLMRGENVGKCVVVVAPERL